MLNVTWLVLNEQPNASIVVTVKINNYLSPVTLTSSTPEPLNSFLTWNNLTVLTLHVHVTH